MLINNKPNNIHTHKNDCEYKHEITLSIYSNNYNSRVKELILNDKIYKKLEKTTVIRTYK